MDILYDTVDTVDGVAMLGTANGAPLTAVKTYPDWQVALIGILTVFVGLICIILICKLFGLLFRGVADKKVEEAPVAAAPALSQEERGAVVAAVSAAIAEELGTDVSALRIHSFRQL